MLRPMQAALAAGVIVIGCHGPASEGTVAPTGSASRSSAPAATASSAAPSARELPRLDGLPEATEAAGGATCGSLSAMKGSDPLPLLAGRLQVRSVAGAEVSPLPHSIMGAPDAPADRSRVYYEAGSSGLAVVATELFETAGPGFADAARKALASPGTEIVRIKTDDPSLGVVARLPTTIPDGSSGTAFLLHGYVVQSDGTVQYLQVGTFPGEFTSVPGCRALALRIARSLAAGTRKLETAPGERAFSLLGKRFKVTVDEGWVLTVQPGPDFDVARIRQLTEFPGPPPLIGMALTHDPDRSSRGPETTSRATVLGTAVEWKLSTIKNDDGEQVYVARLDLPIDGLVLDVWTHSLNDAARRRAMRVVESLARVP